MKKILLIISSLVVMASVANAQGIAIRPLDYHPAPRQAGVRPQSVAPVVTDRSVGVLWLQDGLSANYTALAYPMFQVTGFGNRVEIVGLGAFDSNFTKTNMWTGAGLSMNVLNHEGWNVKVYGGYKGFNIGDGFKRADGKEAWVWGVGLTLPIK